MKNNRKELHSMALLLVVLVSFSCNRSNEENIEYVVYEKNDNEFLQSPILEQIRWTFLETSDSVLIGESPMLSITDKNIFIVDARGSGKVFRFDHSGKFINAIVSPGRGPNEYIQINDVIISKNDNIEIFSTPNITRYMFSEEGLFLSRKEYSYNARGIVKENDAYWMYTGYGNGIRPERLVKIDTSGYELESFLPSEAKILQIAEP